MVLRPVGYHMISVGNLPFLRQDESKLHRIQSRDLILSAHKATLRSSQYFLLFNYSITRGTQTWPSHMNDSHAPTQAFPEHIVIAMVYRVLYYYPFVYLLSEFTYKYSGRIALTWINDFNLDLPFSLSCAPSIAEQSVCKTELVLVVDVTVSGANPTLPTVRQVINTSHKWYVWVCLSTGAALTAITQQWSILWFTVTARS
jgi:hypothetical protein